MRLFGTKKTAAPCDCGGACNGAPVAPPRQAGAPRLSIQVLGSGCAKCNALEAATLEALRALGMDTALDHVTDFAQIAAYGVMTTPALVVNGAVVSSGKVLKRDEIVAILESAVGQCAPG